MLSLTCVRHANWLLSCIGLIFNMCDLLQCRCVVATVVVFISGPVPRETSADVNETIERNFPSGVRMMTFNVGKLV